MYQRFSEIYDLFMADVDYIGWAKKLMAVFEKNGLRGPLKILDAACGTGSVSIPLAKAGHAVTGVDLSESMLNIAAQKARKAGLRIPFVRQSMTALSTHKKQDVVNASCDGVNYLTVDEDVRAFFKSAYDVLRPGGLLCFDVSSRYKLENILWGNTFGETSEKAAYLWKNAYDPSSHLLEMELTCFISADGQSYERFFERHIQRAHSAEELMKQMADCGFTDIAVVDFETGKAPEDTAERLLFTGRKPLES
ncbi:MAG: class I SAM-dependent DNA methyltransferase [Christensenellales bacterium]|jgi:ubiquinone/menaquinone biosynthesis C-methylase UbiE